MSSGPVSNPGSRPPQPEGGRPALFFGRVYGFLASKKLALALLIVILACCLIGVTIFRGKQAGDFIFGTLWFNGLLVLLVVNIAFCFFGRIWRRKLTLISAGMILFHLSFVAILGGVVYNSLFYFTGSLRLTEGETLPNGEPGSYDYISQGRFFNFSKLRGETTLIKMHTDYKVNGSNKRAAYEITVGEGNTKKHGVIYITNNLDVDGVKYLPDKEGYSIMTTLYDRQDKQLFIGLIPLQSLKQKDGSYLYVTGTKDGPASFQYPQDPLRPLFELQIVYRPAKFKERDGEALFQVWPLTDPDSGPPAKPIADGKAAIGAKFKFGDYSLVAEEVRYWVGMKVRYDPGKPIVLASLWVGLIGMLLTFIGRLRIKRAN